MVHMIHALYSKSYEDSLSVDKSDVWFVVELFWVKYFTFRRKLIRVWNDIMTHFWWTSLKNDSRFDMLLFMACDTFSVNSTNHWDSPTTFSVPHFPFILYLSTTVLDRYHIHTIYTAAAAESLNLFITPLHLLKATLIVKLDFIWEKVKVPFFT